MANYYDALINKYRYFTGKRTVTTECLMSLPLTGEGSLNSTAQGLAAEIKTGEVTDFVGTGNPLNTRLEDQLDIVKDIIAKRLAMVEKVEGIAFISAKRERLEALLAKREETEMSTDDLRKSISELGG